jgi:hypothetical protein
VHSTHPIIINWSTGRHLPAVDDDVYAEFAQGFGVGGCRTFSSRAIAKVVTMEINSNFYDFFFCEAFDFFSQIS